MTEFKFWLQDSEWVFTEHEDEVEAELPTDAQVEALVEGSFSCRMLRFAGGIPWTVGQHQAAMASVADSENAPYAVILCALTHDLTETVTGDYPSHIKRWIGRRKFDQIDDAGQEAILAALFKTRGGLPTDEARRLAVKIMESASEEVKVLDRRAVLAESQEFLGPKRREAVFGSEVYDGEEYTDKAFEEAIRGVNRVNFPITEYWNVVDMLCHAILVEERLL